LASQPPAVVGHPGATSWAPGRLDDFVRGSDNNLWHSWSADSGQTFSPWDNLGAPASGLGSSPAAASWAANRIDVFARGGDGQLWHKWWNGAAWSGWEPLGGVLTSAPAVTARASNHLDVFAVGSDRAL